MAIFPIFRRVIHVALIILLFSTKCAVVTSLSLGIRRRARNLLAPSSTAHLADLFEAYDIIQNQPSNSKALEIFSDVASGVSETTKGVVAGTGLIAKRRFEAGEVVALYPIHALGYAKGRDPPAVHPPSQRKDINHCSTRSQTSSRDAIVGTSDLVCFQDEASHFGVIIDPANATENEEEGRVDYAYTMLDPSGRYVFDVHPSRPLVNDMFLAHFVNDAAAADFTNCRWDDDVAAKEALNYLKTSLSNFNCVMTPFGPPPLMAYVTVKPIEAGSEFLASYGLDYWLGKVDDDDNEDDRTQTIGERIEMHPQVRQEIQKYDNEIDAALEKAEIVALSERYRNHTNLLREMVGDHMATVGSAATLRRRSWRR